MTSSKLGADDGLGSWVPRGKWISGWLAAYASNGAWGGVLWCQSAVSVPIKFDHFRPNYLIWAVLQR